MELFYIIKLFKLSIADFQCPKLTHFFTDFVSIMFTLPVSVVLKAHFFNKASDILSIQCLNYFQPSSEQTKTFQIYFQRRSLENHFSKSKPEEKNSF